MSELKESMDFRPNKYFQNINLFRPVTVGVSISWGRNLAEVGPKLFRHKNRKNFGGIFKKYTKYLQKKHVYFFLNFATPQVRQAPISAGCALWKLYLGSKCQSFPFFLFSSPCRDHLSIRRECRQMFPSPSMKQACSWLHYKYLNRPGGHGQAGHMTNKIWGEHKAGTWQTEGEQGLATRPKRTQGRGGAHQVWRRGQGGTWRTRSADAVSTYRGQPFSLDPRDYTSIDPKQFFKHSTVERRGHRGLKA